MESKEDHTASAAVKRRFEEALLRFQKQLKPEETQQFAGITLANLESAISMIQKEQYHATGMPRVLGFVEAFKQFGELIEAFLNSSDYVAAVWGPMKFVLQVSGPLLLPRRPSNWVALVLGARPIHCYCPHLKPTIPLTALH